jgi:integrase/recombinase XerD
MRYKRCACPIWCMGTIQGQHVRKSLNLTNWQAANELIRNWEADSSITGDSTTVSGASELFIKDCRSRYLSYATLGKYELLFRELNGRYGNWNLKSISAAELDSYRGTWKLSPISARKKLERLRTFFRFCVDRDLIRKNPATSLKPPKVFFKPTMPFSDEEYEKIIWATEVYPPQGIYGEKNKIRMRAFVRLLKHSGLRIRDAVCLRRSAVKDGKLFLYTQKTGTPVTLPLPPFVVEDLETVAVNETHFFWSGLGLPKSAVADFQRALQKLFELAGVRGHAHRFRDTFAVNLLLGGVPMEQVSIILGHTSIKTTERHYAPWVRERQSQMEILVKKSWTQRDVEAG